MRDKARAHSLPLVTPARRGSQGAARPQRPTVPGSRSGTLCATTCGQMPQPRAGEIGCGRWRGSKNRIQAARRHLNGLAQDAPATFKVRQPLPRRKGHWVGPCASFTSGGASARTSAMNSGTGGMPDAHEPLIRSQAAVQSGSWSPRSRMGSHLLNNAGGGKSKGLLRNFSVSKG